MQLQSKLDKKKEGEENVFERQMWIALINKNKTYSAATCGKRPFLISFGFFS
jgi:hypothetical protein